MALPTALAVMAIVVIVVGAGTYVALNAMKPTSSLSKTCQPANTPACSTILSAHDMSLLVPLSAVQTGLSVPFTALLPSGESGSNFTFNFGDGSSPVTQPSSTVTHSFTYPGSYIASVTANVKGTTHDSFSHLVPITVTANAAALNASDVPTVSGMITANTTVTGGSATGVIAPQGKVSVTGVYSGSPTNPQFVPQSPTITAVGGQISSPTNTSVSASADVSFQTPGIYQIKFVGTAVSGAGSSAVSATQNYIWTVFVTPTGVSGSLLAGASGKSPHPGTLERFYFAPGGSKTTDPSIAYDSVSGEVVLNLFQTLIQFNGTDAGPSPANFVPDLAVCVPGAPQCGTLFGSGGASGTDLAFPQQRAFTFVINNVAKFYDPKTGASWNVYPTDVLFTYLRTEAFANDPFYQYNPGWLIGQTLLNPGNGSWDASGNHGAINNTPSNEFGTILVNSSAYCPSVAMSSYHGCVTFIANGSGIPWPFFLEIAADAQGGGIEPCGWYSAQGSGIPGWTSTNATYSKDKTGDKPCLLPGGARSSDSTGYARAVAAMSPTSWDSWEQAASLPPYVGNTQWNAVASGPYYLANLIIGSQYTLKANPAYAQNPTCTWSGCMPPVNGYVPNVDVVWEPTAQEGEQAYQAGVADSASIPATDVSILLQLIQQGKIHTTSAPTISIYFWAYNFNFPIAGAQKYTTTPITVPSDFYSWIAIREFVARAYPYDTAQRTVNTVDGITYDFNYGGAIPQFMGNYYPRNVSFPSGDPSGGATTQGSAQWWLAQGRDPTSPYYDPELKSCTTSTPCVVPFMGETGSPSLDQLIALLAAGVEQQSGGTIKFATLDINFADLVTNLGDPGGSNPMPMYQLGWAPDYPDPTDYVAPLYGALYTSSDDVQPQLTTVANFSQLSYPGGTCPAVSDYVGWAHLAENLGGIPNACQGQAYKALLNAMNISAVMDPTPARVLLYNFIEQIANGLALYLYWGQFNLIVSGASWVDMSTPNTSVMLGGGNQQTWWTWNGNGMIS